MIQDAKPSLEELKHHGVKGQRWGVRKREDVGAAIRKIANAPNPLYYKNVQARIGKDIVSPSKKEAVPNHTFNTSPDKQAKRNAKAKKFEDRSDDLQRRIDAGNKNISKLNAEQSPNIFTKVKLSQLKQDQRILAEEKAKADKSAEAKRQGKLTPTQKKLLIGGAVVGGLLIAGVAAQQINSGQFRQNVNRGREILTGKKFKFKEAPELKGNWSADQIHKLIVPDINEGYPTGIGSGMNCRRCTFAYEMRRRGYDVAATRTPTASGQNAIGLFNVLDTEAKDVSQRSGMRLLTNPPRATLTNSPADRILSIATSHGSVNKIDAPENIFSVLSKQPERSRGELGVFWNGGGGHSMAYEIINGVPHIFDGQTGEKYSSMAEIAANLPEIGAAGFTRLDNVNLDTKFVQRWVKNVKL